MTHSIQSSSQEEGLHQNLVMHRGLSVLEEDAIIDDFFTSFGKKNKLVFKNVMIAKRTVK